MDIKQQIQQGIQQHASGARFGLSPIPRHIHNNVDSPYVFQPILTYIGVIGIGVANQNPVTINLLPKGWVVNWISLGHYSVTHNLDTTQYGCVATAAQSTNVYAVPVVSSFKNITYFTWLDAATGFNADTGLSFTLTVIGNRNTQLPVYVGTQIT